MKNISKMIKAKLLLELSKEIRCLIANGYTQNYIAKITKTTQPIVSYLQTNTSLDKKFSIDRIIDIFSRLDKSVVIDTSKLTVIVF